MTDTIREPFCPLYREAIDAAPWKSAPSGHAGLLFDKFANAWRFKRDRDGNRESPTNLEFDKGTGDKKDRAGEWVTRFAREIGDRARLSEACQRQREMVTRLGGRVLLVTNTDRFVTGMGREHPLENGFAWHHTLGVPYLPGSSLKGMLRAWVRETDGALDRNERGKDVFVEPVESQNWFGTQGNIGQLIMFDMLPLEPPKLSVDVMTPHYGPYYQDEKGNNVPGDWHSPVPITFLTVAPGQMWQIGIAPRNSRQSQSDDVFKRVIGHLLDALSIAGAGAKTAVGYGRFEVDREAEERLEREAEKRRLAAEQAARKAAEQAAFEASLANDSEPLRKLKQLQREQSWKRDTGDNTMLSGLETFVDENPDLPEDCVAWIREWFESIPNYAGVWEEPDAMKGKKKNKNKYGSSKIRELVKRLKG